MDSRMMIFKIYSTLRMPTTTRFPAKMQTDFARICFVEQKNGFKSGLVTRWAAKMLPDRE